MNSIKIIHKGEVVFLTIVNDGERVVLKDIIEERSSELYNMIYSPYNKSTDVVTYWLEYKGFVFPDNKQFSCRCDVEFVLKCAIVDRDDVNTTVKYNGFSDIPLNFTCDDANGSTIKFNNSSNDIEIHLEYSSDNLTWATWDGNALNLIYGETVYIRGKNYRINSFTGGGYFEITGATKAAGNIMSLICNKNNQFSDIVPEACFASLFIDCEITTAPELPCMQLSAYCYDSIFYGCMLLTIAPELPASVLYEGCYSYMFYECTSLIKAPELPATILGNGCCEEMFHGCTSLTTGPSILPAIELIQGCYARMFYGCTSLTVAPELPSTILAVSCYAEMFYGCTSLTVAPELPALYTTDNCVSDSHITQTIPDYCYYFMFAYSGITEMPELKSQFIGERSYCGMFLYCTSLSTVKKLELYASKKQGCMSMFNRCTSLEKAPTLVFLEEGFYVMVSSGDVDIFNSMLANCSSLSEIRIERKDFDLPVSGVGVAFNPIGDLYASDHMSKNWVQGVNANGTFYEPEEYPVEYIGDNGIPSGWTVINN